METKIEQTVTGNNNAVVDNTQIENTVDSTKFENSVENNRQGTNCNNKPLTPYQKYKNSRNQNGKKYFEFYDDIKVYTHNIYDW